MDYIPNFWLWFCISQNKIKWKVGSRWLNREKLHSVTDRSQKTMEAHMSRNRQENRKSLEQWGKRTDMWLPAAHCQQLLHIHCCCPGWKLMFPGKQRWLMSLPTFTVFTESGLGNWQGLSFSPMKMHTESERMENKYSMQTKGKNQQEWLFSYKTKYFFSNAMASSFMKQGLIDWKGDINTHIIMQCISKAYFHKWSQPHKKSTQK